MIRENPTLAELLAQCIDRYGTCGLYRLLYAAKECVTTQDLEERERLHDALEGFYAGARKPVNG